MNNIKYLGVREKETNNCNSFVILLIFVVDAFDTNLSALLVVKCVDVNSEYILLILENLAYSSCRFIYFASSFSF